MAHIVYHGSLNGNIKELTAHKSTHQKECIYGTFNKVIALLFTNQGNRDLDTKISFVHGKLELLERREGVLNSLYDKSGYVYELDGKTFARYDYLWSGEVISFENKLKPLRKTYYENILNELKKEEDKGNIIIYRYPNRPKDVPLDNSDLIDKFINFEENGLKGALNHMLSIYPEFTPIVEEKIKSISK